MDPREQRGLVIAALCKLTPQEDGNWIVPSQSGANRNYIVDLDRKTCTCQDHQDGYKCKHLYAVEFTVKRELRTGSIKDTETMTFTPKKTYTQDWPAYNLAQTTEKHRFQVLLHDLSRGVTDFTRKPGPGRKPVPASNAVFAAAFKVYSTVSTRRFACDLKDALERGHVSQPIHYNSICAYLENPELTPRLHSLITLSSLPLVQVDKVFAADSTGFSTGRFVRWFDEKYGVTRSGHDWVKAHIMCGTKTNVVTAVTILENRNAADAPQFKHLLNDTAKNFTILEVSGDKAYSSDENIEAVYRAGGLPYIQFKENATGGIGGFFEKSFHYYSLHREDFLQHYHQRSNVESTFSAIKRKFGDYVRSRTNTAMLNEVLCKILCHNITCLIHSQCELGIEPVFWGNSTPREEPVHAS